MRDHVGATVKSKPREVKSFSLRIRHSIDSLFDLVI
jgi:hypothetical protein